MPRPSFAAAVHGCVYALEHLPAGTDATPGPLVRHARELLIERGRTLVAAAALLAADDPVRRDLGRAVAHLARVVDPGPDPAALARALRFWRDQLAALALRLDLALDACACDARARAGA